MSKIRVVVVDDSALVRAGEDGAGVASDPHQIGALGHALPFCHQQVDFNARVEPAEEGDGNRRHIRYRRGGLGWDTSARGD